MGDSEKLAATYRRAGREVRSALFGIDPTNYRPDVAERAMEEISKVVRSLNVYAVRWADESVEWSYGVAAKKARAILELLGKTEKKPVLFDRKRKIKDDLAVTVIRANNSILGVAERYLALTAMASREVLAARVQEFSFGEAQGEIGKMAQAAVAREETRKTLAGQVRQYLQGYINEDNFIEINGRLYQADKYAMMVARTTLREAQTAATLDLCSAFENDLVQWSDHGTRCEDCHNYEGQIYSISGKHPTYPPLTESPPLHPNCEHSLLPTTDVAIGTRKAGLLPPPQALPPEIVTAAKAKVRKERKKKEPKPKPAEQPKPIPEVRKAEVEWKPSMTAEEAREWSKDSAVRDVFNHNTSRESSKDAIMKSGFKVGDGAVYGRGVYMSTVVEADYGAVNLKLMMNVKNVVQFQHDFWRQSQDWWYKKGYYRTVKEKVTNTQILNRWANAMGYDGFRISAEWDTQRIWYVVFDPKKVTVIK